jgi:seryl-tRNA synthetase
VNKTRRGEITAAVQRLTELAAEISDLRDTVENIRDEEQEYYDNMPESIQSGERGQNAEAAISELDDALSALEDFDTDAIVTSLETAAE